jgi:hypothetical protein
MKKNILILIIAFFLTDAAFSQARISFSSNPFIVISNGAWLVIDNPNANAMPATGGKIITEAETNRVRWNIGTTTGTYTVPFADNDDGQAAIPLSITVGTAGVGAGRIDFSTYDAPSAGIAPANYWDNYLYKPSGVNHVSDYLTGASVNSGSRYAIDRFWIIDANGYTTRPALSQMVFTYIDAEHTAASNVITEANLGAQFYNGTSHSWDDMLPTGTVNTGANTVTVTTAISAANFRRVWTLSDATNPLPVTLLNLSADCENGNVTVKWATASEINCDYYSIERSFDGINFQLTGQVVGAGNSNVINTYSYTDNVKTGQVVYYRLKQTDYDGSFAYYGPVQTSCTGGSDKLDFVFMSPGHNGNIQGQVHAPANGNYNLSVYDNIGRLIVGEEIYLSKGNNNLSLNKYFSTGIYYFTVAGNNEIATYKVFIR